MLGIAVEETHFDQEVQVNINTVLMGLNQIGVGVHPGVTVKDDTTTWMDFLGEREDLEATKSFVYLKVRLLFDPPTNSFTIDAMRAQADEIEWRLRVNAEGGQSDDQ